MYSLVGHSCRAQKPNKETLFSYFKKKTKYPKTLELYYYTVCWVQDVATSSKSGIRKDVVLTLEKLNPLEWQAKQINLKMNRIIKLQGKTSLDIISSLWHIFRFQLTFLLGTCARNSA